MNDLALKLDAYAKKMYQALGPESKKEAEKKIATMLRANMRKRLTDQVDIYDEYFEPRQKEKYTHDQRFTKPRYRGQKFKVGAIRQKKMLLGFRDKAWLKIQFETDKLQVGYKAGRTGKTAEVHNEGQAQKIGGRQGKHWAQYPERRWIGFSEEDKAAIDEILEEFLTLK